MNINIFYNFIFLFATLLMCGCSHLQVLSDPESTNIVMRMKELNDQGIHGEDEALAERLWDRCVSLYGVDSPCADFADLSLITAYTANNDWGRVQEVARRKIARVKRGGRVSHGNIYSCMYLDAFCAMKLMQYSYAEKAARELLSMLGDSNDNNMHYTSAMSVIIQCSIERGDYSSAHRYIEEMSLKSKDQYEVYMRRAELYLQMRDYASAEPWIDKGMEIEAKNRASGSLIDWDGAETKKGELLRAVGKYREANEIWIKRLQYYARRYGAERLAAAQTMRRIGLGFLEYDYPRSFFYLSKAETVYSNIGKIDPLDKASLLEGLGVYWGMVGDVAKACEYHGRALDVLKASGGEIHPDYGYFIDALGRIYAGDRKYHEAVALFADAQKRVDAFVDITVASSSDGRKFDVLATSQKVFSSYISALVVDRSRTSLDVGGCYNAWLRRKGLILDIQKSMNSYAFSSDVPEVAGKLKDLRDLNTERAGLYFAGVTAGDSKAHGAKISAVESRIKNVEDALSRYGGRYAARTRLAGVTYRDVAMSLPDGAVLLDFARVRKREFSLAKTESAQLGPEHYYMFVVKGQRPDALAVHDLGDALAIDDGVKRVRSLILQSRGQASVGTELKAQAAALHARIFSPLAGQLAGVKRLYVSPDGDLNTLPFEVLVQKGGRYVIDDYLVSYLESGRSLAIAQDGAVSSAKCALFGGANYDMELPGVASAAVTTAGGGTASKGLKKPTARFATDNDPRGLDGLYFDELPGARAEVMEVSRILGAGDAVRAGEEATEPRLFEVRSPRILHLATHGFYLSDAGVDGTGWLGKSDPMLRSGFVLSGANYAIRFGGYGANDGIVTAAEALKLNLDGTQLVVLSACESGLGAATSGDGVYGLRRAFSQAGARNMLMSMWSVPDKATGELMKHFYEGMARGLDKPSALRNAALTVRREREAGREPASPYYWGAFVLSGGR